MGSSCNKASGDPEVVEAVAVDDGTTDRIVMRNSTPGDNALSSKKFEDNLTRRISISQTPGPCGDEAEWLNQFIKFMYPNVSAFAEDLIGKSLVPMVDSLLPSQFKGRFKLDHFTMGEASPRFGPIHTWKRKGGEVVIDIGVDIAINTEVKISFLSAKIGLKDIELHGFISICFVSPSKQPPFWGGLQIYFVDTPDLNLTFTGALSIAEYPPIRRVVRNALLKVLGELVVLPGRLAVDLMPVNTEDVADLQYPDPLVILRFTLLSGTGLQAKDSAFKDILMRKLSDPYVVVQFGATVWTSPVVRKSLTPVWKDNNTVDLLVYDGRQSVKLKVWDEDHASMDDFMGEASAFTAKKLLSSFHKGNWEAPLTDSGNDVGCLTFSFRPLKLLPEQNVTDTLKKSPGFVLCVKITEASGVPKGFIPPFLARVTLGKTVLHSKPSQPQRLLAFGLMAEEIVMACNKLGKRGMPPADIADSLGLLEEQVTAILHSNTNTEEAQKMLVKALEKREMSTPQFNEIIRHPFPNSNEVLKGSIHVEFLDVLRKKVPGVCEIMVMNVMNAMNMRIDGPFTTSGKTQFKGYVRIQCMAEDPNPPSLEAEE